MDLYDKLKELIFSFAAQKVPYALCGGRALAVCEIPCATQAMNKVDTTARAVSNRLKLTARLRGLCLKLSLRNRTRSATPPASNQKA